MVFGLLEKVDLRSLRGLNGLFVILWTLSKIRYDGGHMKLKCSHKMQWDCSVSRDSSSCSPHPLLSNHSRWSFQSPRNMHSRTSFAQVVPVSTNLVETTRTSKFKDGKGGNNV